MSGPKLAALYGLVPNKLGYCGPKQELLKKFILGQLSIPEIIPTLEKFEAAYAYYQLIAAKNKIASPFNKKVVEAYWLGNELLDKVSVNDLRQFVVEKFSKPGLLTKKEAAARAKNIPVNSRPHHSFHVLVLGAVTGSVDFNGNTKLKDVCRIGWGRVQQIVIPAKSRIHPAVAERVKPGMIKNIKTGKLIVSYNPLVGEKIIKFGQPIKKELFCDKEIFPSVKIGDWVSFHWNWAVQKLDEEDIVNLHKYTQKTLDTLYGKR